MHSVNSMSRVISAFERICRERADKTAMIHLVGGKPVSTSFSEMRQGVAAARGFLAQNGVAHGDRLLAFANSGFNLCVFLIAAFELGACVMYVDIHAGQENLKRIFAQTRPSFVLVSDKTRHFRVLFREINKIKRVINIDHVHKGAAPSVAAEIREDAEALITVTTGSTGKPKLFVRTHGDLWQQLKLVADNMDSEDGEQVALTTSYIYIFANLLMGFTTLLPNVNLGSGNTKAITKKLKRFDLSEVTTIITTPDFCLRTPNMYPKLRTLYSGGAILNLNEAKRIQSAFPCEVIHIYGSTECNLIASVDLGAYIAELEKTGKCLLGTVCRGVDVNISENGSILVKSEALLTKGADGSVFTEEYYNTNDIGFLEDGMLFYRGKGGFCLTLGSKTVYANEVEQRLIRSFPSIGKCAAVAHDRRCYLFLEDRGLPCGEIAAFLQKEYGVPFYIKTLRAIPRDVKHHTKINYLQLIAQLEKSH